MSFQLIYSSESTTPMQADDLEAILEDARARNAASGITGALVYVDGVFLQILEGSAVKVKELMQRISRDLRHQTVTILLERHVASAAFADWTMAYVSATPEQVAQWAGFGGVADVPSLLKEIGANAQRTMQLTEGILKLLTSDPRSARP